MPLLEKRTVPDGFIAIWRQEESLYQLLSRITLSVKEQSVYQRINWEERRKQWLIWHVMVRELIGKEVTTRYNHIGAPILIGDSGHISISHSGEYIAMYYHKRKCGLDIELLDRKYEAISRRYLTQQEKELAPGRPDGKFLALAWCAKEAVYKYSGIRGLNFLKELRLTEIDMEEYTLTLTFREKVVRCGYTFFNGNCMVWTLT